MLFLEVVTRFEPDGRMKAIQIGGMPDHVQILLSLPSTLSIAKAIQLIKGGSSKWVHETFPKHRLFGWQVKYGAFSVSASQLDKIVAHAFQRAGSGGFPAARWWYFQGAPGPWRAHLDTTTKSTGTDRGCVRSTSRSGTARPGVFGQLSDSGHPHLLRLVLRTQPRSGGGSKMRPTSLGASRHCPRKALGNEARLCAEHQPQRLARAAP